MSDNEDVKQEAQQQAEGQQFLIQRVYLKDLSFEAPLGPKAFVAKIQPKIGQELGTESKKIEDNLYEATLKLTITAKIDEETAFLVEVQQAGIFLIKGIEGDNLGRVLNTTCPQILFPYAREAIDSALIKGSFPPVLLPPVNFDALFVAAMKEKQKQETVN